MLKTFALQQKPSASPAPQRTKPVFSSSRSSLLSPNAKTLADLCTPLIQTKLTVNEPGDQYEQEADRMAAEVMHSNSGPSRVSLPMGMQPVGGNNGRTLSKTPVAAPARRWGHNFSKVRVSAPPMQIQPKLTVNQPGDQYEQEADRVAEEVMQIPDFFGGAISTGGLPNVQKKCAACESGGGLCSNCAEEEKRLQRTSLATTITPLIQREDAGVSHKCSQVSPQVAANINALRGGGQPLPLSLRAFFEPRFGVDFSDVRVHTDARATELASSVNARAFTVGRDIVFGDREYAPENSSGKRLIAHELTHVMQQADGSIPMLQRDMVGQRACPLREDLPSGDLSSQVRFDSLGGGRVYVEQFNMNIDWDGTGPTCDCRCGEYRQFVKGHARVNNQTLRKKLYGNAYLEDSRWHEDGDDQGRAYGHRDFPEAPDDRFINPDDRETGCSYRGSDSPWLEARPGDFVDWYLEFKGQTYDRCKAAQGIFPYGPIHRWWIRFNPREALPGNSPSGQEYPSTVATRHLALKADDSRLHRDPPRYPVLSFPEDFPAERRLVPYFIAPQERPFLTFVHFRNTGNTSNPECVSTSLGKFPYGLPYNAMEIGFDVPDVLLQHYRSFRFRRFIQETLWQQVNGRWSQVSATPTAQPDHPSLEPACTQPPHLYDYDSPGWYQLRSTRILKGYEGQLTHQLATQIVLRQNFREWVEGETAEGSWRRVSQIVSWHNIVGLRRSRPTSDWHSTHLTEIELGHTSLEQLAAEVGEQPITPLIQRETKPPEEDEELQQTKETAENMPQITTKIADDINAMRGGGQPLPPSVQAFFETRFGADFTGVRVHMDTRAAETAREVNARAFTVGKDIVFGAEEYAPETKEGQKLMAHELVHVVQQNAENMGEPIIQRDDQQTQSAPSRPGQPVTFVPIPSTLAQAFRSEREFLRLWLQEYTNSLRLLSMAGIVCRIRRNVPQASNLPEAIIESVVIEWATINSITIPPFSLFAEPCEASAPVETPQPSIEISELIQTLREAFESIPTEINIEQAHGMVNITASGATIELRHRQRGRESHDDELLSIGGTVEWEGTLGFYTSACNPAVSNRCVGFSGSLSREEWKFGVSYSIGSSLPNLADIVRIFQEAQNALPGIADATSSFRSLDDFSAIEEAISPQLDTIKAVVEAAEQYAETRSRQVSFGFSASISGPGTGAEASAPVGFQFTATLIIPF